MPVAISTALQATNARARPGNEASLYLDFIGGRAPGTH